MSIIIVNWNSGTLLSRCLEHVERQTLRPDIVYVVDNASTDGSAARAAEFANVKVMTSQDNIGFAAGNNLALMETDTKFVALLNPDAFPEPDWLEKLVTTAQANPDTAAFGSRQLCQSNPELLDGIGDSYNMSGLPWRQRHLKRQQSDDLVAREIFAPCAAAALYRRKLLLDIGCFDEDFFCYVEDVDLGFRLRLAGHKALYVPGAVVHHVGAATTGGDTSEFALYHGHRNLVPTFVKNMPTLLFWPLLSLHLLLNVYTLVRFSMVGRGDVIYRAKVDAIKLLPRTWAKRKAIQAGRLASSRDIWRALDKQVFPTKKHRN